MNNVHMAFWNICDTLAGEVDELCAAIAFVTAADQLPATSDWRLSAEYQTAKQTIAESERG